MLIVNGPEMGILNFYEDFTIKTFQMALREVLTFSDDTSRDKYFDPNFESNFLLSTCIDTCPGCEAIS